MKIVVTESQLKEIMGMEIGERSRSFAFTRKKRLFPKSAIKANPNRFKKYDKEVKGIEESIDMNELDFESFHADENLSELRNAIDRNKTVSVAFVKKDGTVRHMAIRKNLSSYVGSDREKSDAQMNVEQNHNLKKVVDINSYIRDLKRMRLENRDNPNPVDDNELKQMAAKKAWRSINLQNVLGFLVSGKFVDLRDENEIMNRFGPEIHGQLTKSMVRSMEQEQGENNQEEIQEMDNSPENNDIIETIRSAWNSVKNNEMDEDVDGFGGRDGGKVTLKLTREGNDDETIPYVEFKYVFVVGADEDGYYTHGDLYIEIDGEDVERMLFKEDYELHKEIDKYFRDYVDDMDLDDDGDPYGPHGYVSWSDFM